VVVVFENTENTAKIVMDYKERGRNMRGVPRLSHGRRLLRSDEGSKKMSIDFVFSDHSMGIEFLRDIGLLQKTRQCKSCGQDMTWSVR
jgi:hypothetical protein